MSGLSRGSRADILTILPAGTVLPFAGATAPTGWALCDGSIVSRSEYPELYLAIGDAWGNGDGSTTFHLPDMRGRFMRGVDNGAGRDGDAGSRTTSNAGGNSGDTVGSVQGDNFGSHQHGVKGRGYGEGGVSDILGGSGADYGVNSNYSSSGSITYSNTVSPEGGSENRPKNANVNYIIKL